MIRSYEINFELVEKLRNMDEITPVAEFKKWLLTEYKKSVAAMLATESEDLMRKKAVRAQTFKEVLELIGRPID